jgi:hypothetical protein
MNNKYYTYAYLREDRTPYYIGKGEGNRAYKNQNRSCPVPKDRNRIIFLKKNITEEEAFKHETYLIAVLGRKDLGTGILRNLTDGGEGASGAVRTKEMREHLSRIRKGTKMPEEYREACRERMKNFKHTDEAKNKISKANSGRKWDEDSRKRGSIAQKERYTNGNNSLANLTSEQRKEAAKKSQETNKRNKTGAYELSEEERRERAKKNYHKTLGVVNSTMWKCLVTGHISNAGALTIYQRSRGIDTSQRVKI